MSLHDPAGNLAVLRETPERIFRLTRDLDRRAETWKPPDDGFSILENVCHLRDIEAEGFSLRIERLLTENDPILPDPDGANLARERGYNSRRLDAELAAFREARHRSLGLLEGAAPAAWRRTGSLETVGRISLEDLVRRMAEHDRGHIEEIMRLVESRKAR